MSARPTPRRAAALDASAEPLPAAVVVALPALLAAAVYANAIGNGFVWDDPIVLKRQLVVFHSVADVLFPPRGIPQFSPDYYRPLTIASLLLDRAVGGEQPFAYHLTVVVAHVLATAILAWFALSLFGADAVGRAGALAAAAVFAVHPVHTESVAWIAGRSDVLATMGVLGAVVAHRGGPWSWRRTAATGLLVLGALSAKETAVTALPLLVLGDLLLAPRALSTPGLLRRYAGPAVAVAVYGGLRLTALTGVTAEAPDPMLAERSAGDVLGALAVYGGRLVAPVELNAFIDSVPSTPIALGGTAVALVVVCGSLFWAWRWGRRLPLYLGLWVGLTLVPSLAIIWKIPEAPMAERYLYLPSVGWCLCVGYVFAVALRRCASGPARWAVVTLAIVVVAAGAVATWRRNGVWRDNVAFWRDGAEKSRRFGTAWRNLGAAYLEAGRLDEARGALETALQRRNSRTGLETIYSNLGTLALQRRDYGAAVQSYQRALEAHPEAPDVLFNLGLATLWAGGGTVEAAGRALPFYERAERRSPHDADIQAAIGQVFVVTGDPARAIVHLRRALELHPREETAASIRVQLKRLESARQPEP